MEEFSISSEYILLHQLLKATDLVPSGGIAKAVIQNGEVLVNSAIETRRGKKLRKGDVVQYDNRKILIG